MDLSLPVLPLHRHPQYKMQCCQLINDEWHRSTSARLRSLENSCDSLPTSLILLKNEKVIGHCKLSAIPRICDGCFIESVVIDKSLRGQGFGTYLMKTVEEYCKCVLKLNVIYLSTKGQELFYSKLGYTLCQPVSIYGNISSTNFSVKVTNNHTIITNNCQENIKTKIPTAPPMPVNRVSNTTSKVYMNKILI